jgi:acyl-CoA synthetase (NDP forming)
MKITTKGDPVIHKLDSFFEPRSVAVIGATSARHKPGHDILLNIMTNGYAGELYLVNPKGGEIAGSIAPSAIFPRGLTWP